MAESISSALEDLRAATERLLSPMAKADLDRMEDALAVRQKAVTVVSELVDRYPAEFTPEHLDRLRQCQDLGKRAHEHLLETRRQGWITGTELTRKYHILRTFARYSPGCEHRRSSR